MRSAQVEGCKWLKVEVNECRGSIFLRCDRACEQKWVRVPVAFYFGISARNSASGDWSTRARAVAAGRAIGQALAYARVGADDRA
jgi:hypothetical protein